MWYHPAVASTFDGAHTFCPLETVFHSCSMSTFMIHFLPQSLVHERSIFGPFLWKNLFVFSHCCHVVGFHFVEVTDGLHSLIRQPTSVFLVSLREKPNEFGTSTDC